MLKIYKDEKLYQWDTNRAVVVNDLNIKEVHFANCLCEEARVCEVKPGFGGRVAVIPNELLQEYVDIKAWGYDVNNHTKYCATFPVEKRTKPADYVYTPTEVKRYEALEKRIEAVEANTNTGIVRYDTTQKLSKFYQSIAQENLGITAQYAYNFTKLYNELTYAPKDAAALTYIVENWNKIPMSIYVQGYPVIGIDLNDRYLRVLKDDRLLYSFRWKVENGRNVILSAHSLVKLTNESEIINIEKNGEVEVKTFKPELLPTHSHSVDDVTEITDYIVEQGRTEDGWDYCKWASGKGECWKNIIAKQVPKEKFVDSGLISLGDNGLGSLIGNVNFGIYWTRDITIQFNYPFEFENHPVETATLSNGSVWLPFILIATGKQSIKQTDSYRICSFKQPDGETDFKIALHVVGKYKREEAAE